MTGDLVVNAHVSVPMRELTFRFSRSSGPGGQHVNKTETRVEVVFDVAHSAAFNDAQRGMVLEALASRLDSDGCVHVVASASRSQLQNKDAAIARLASLLAAALRPRKARIPTAPSRSSRERRLEDKRTAGERKRRRGPIALDE